MLMILYAFVYEKNNADETQKVGVMRFFNEGEDDQEKLPDETPVPAGDKKEGKTETGNKQETENRQETGFSEKLKSGSVNGVLIRLAGENTVTLRYMNEDRTYSISNAQELKDCIGKLCDIEGNEGRLFKITIKDEPVEDYVLRSGVNEMETEKRGMIKFAGDCVYIKKTDKEGQAEYTYIDAPKLNNVRVPVKVYMKDDRACALILEDEPQTKVAVIIRNNDNTSIMHKKLTVSCEGGLVIRGLGSDKENEKKNSIEIAAGESFSKAVIIPADGELKITSMKRCENSSYKGYFIIYNTGDGLVLVNNVPLEDYVAGVLSGEMPKDSGRQALAALAVCARTYALYAMMHPKYEEYGAGVDDSSASQVYRSAPDKAYVQAAEDTKGKVMIYEEKLAGVYYFSTSCGYIAGASPVFGNRNMSYMRSFEQTSGNAVTGEKEEVRDYSKEQDFRKFINSGYKEREYIEKNVKWFRWKCAIPLSDIEKRHNGSKDEKNVGKIKSIKVLKRDRSGLALSLEVTGDKKKIVIEGQGKIRKYLAPAGCEIEAGIGDNIKTVKSLKLLPSAFCYIDIKKDKAVITGGGYGHGAGLSQNGAIMLSKAGFGYEDILRFYYKGIALTQVGELVKPAS